MITGYVFDTTALVNFVTGAGIYTRAAVRAAIADQGTIVVPSAVLAAGWRSVPEPARKVLDRVSSMEVFHVDDLDDVIAQQVGLLTAGTDLGVDEGQAAWSARIRQWPLVTARGDRYAGITRLTIDQIP
ncbi:hypothetical protein [Nocardia sp. NPDC051570]|uniref:hypothetical protein n=1 Tax=Nocardia sp. NPDC051570 TaxID=3364324 RepID=UPI0037A9749D